MNLTRRERRQLVTLLGKLQTHLESAIESSILPNTDKAQHGYKRIVAQDRKDWRAAEDWIKRLEAGR